MRTSGVKTGLRSVSALFVCIFLIYIVINPSPTLTASEPSLFQSISISRQLNRIEAQASGAVDNSTWRNNYQVATATNPDCSSTTFGPASSVANVVNIVRSDIGKWVCFTVKKSNPAVSIYGKYRITFLDAEAAIASSGPNITVTQKDGNGDVLTATSDASNLPANPAWYHSNPLTESGGNEPDCSDSNVNWFKGNKAKYIEYDKYYCFKVADISNNVGYGKLKTKPAAPVLTSSVRFVPPVGINPPKQAIRASATDNIPALKSGHEFGSSLSSDGNRFVVGAPKQDGNSGSQTGAVYVYAKASNEWILEQRISDEASRFSFNYLESSDNFGQAVAIEGDWLAVGAPGDDSHSGADTGAVYIFRKHPVGWVISQRIYDTYAGFTALESGDQFGSSLALSGDRLVVGAPGDDGHSGANTGAVYVFKLTDANWVLEWAIADASTGFTALESGDRLGHNLVLDGRWLAIGGPGADGATRNNTGAVYIFQKTRSTWSYKQKISDEISGVGSLSTGDEFGSALSLEGNTLVIGAQKKTLLSVRSGAVYVFTRGQYSDTFSFQQEISGGNSGLGTSIKTGDKFGAGVGLSGNRLAVSATGDSPTGMSNTGAVYIFKKVAAAWSLEQELSYDTSFNFLRAGDALGADLVLVGSWLLASAPLNDGIEGSDSGTVYILEKDSNDSWSDQSKLRNTGIAIKADSWQNFKTSDTTKPDCDADDTFGTAGSTANEVQSTSSTNNNKWACFRVQAQADSTIYGYIKNRFDYNKPSISGQIDGSGNLVVNVSDANMSLYSNWRVSNSGTPGRGSTLNNLCDATSRVWWGTTTGIGNTKKLGYVNYGAWYCVTFRDKVENYSPAKFQATLPIAVSQTSTTVTASVPEDINPHLANEDKFGGSVSLDGDWMVAGARDDDGQSGSNTGAVYVFKRTGTTWALKQKISDKSAGFTALAAEDKFGTAVSLSGNRFAVGAPEDDTSSKTNAGAVYIFKKGASDVWSLEEIIDADHTRDIKPNAAFGQSVSLDGLYLAVGAPGHQSSAPSNDEAYVFKKKDDNSDDWEKQKKIDNDATGLKLSINNIQGEPGLFGISVSLDGVYLAIGAPGYDIRRSDSEETIISNSSGAISVFQRTGSSWSEVDYIHEKYYQKRQHPIQSPDKVNFIDEGDNFGHRVSLDGDYLAVSSYGDNGRGYGDNTNYGAVHILERSGNSWNHQKEIAKNEVPSLSQKARFGSAIDIDADNNRLAIGAKDAKSSRSATTTKAGGEVYIFIKSGGSWQLERAFVLTASNDLLAGVADAVYLWSTLDKLGASIALDGDYLVAGAPGDQGSRYEDSTTDTFGAVHTFYRQPGYNWTFGNRLKDNPVKLAATNPWGYFKTQTAPAPADCNSSGTFTDITSNNSSVSITSSDKWVCFRVKSPQLPGASGNFISYRAYQILDLSAPTIKLVQDNALIAASSPGLPEESFEYFVSNTDPDCSASNTTATYTVNHLATNMTADQWVCFRALSLNGVFAYLKRQLDLTPPVIDIHKTDNTIRALSEATDLPDSPFWQKKGPQNYSDCSQSTTGFTYGNWFAVSAEGQSVGKYYCFKVADKNGNQSFGEIKLGATDPVISISQSKGSPDKISGGVSNHSSVDVDTGSWQNFKTSDATEPDCNSGNQSLFGSASSNADEVTTTSSDNGQWVCFRVKTDDNIYGYAKQEIDYNTPDIQISRPSATRIVATSEATDLSNPPDWQKAGPHNSSDCDSSTTGFSSGNSFTAIVVSKYYCFWLTDNNGNDTYKEIQVLNNPEITITQRPGTSQDRVSATATTFSANGIAGDSWAYLEGASGSTPPGCNQAAPYTGTGNSVDIDSSDNEQWLCFKVKNDNNQDEWGYATYQIDYNKPNIYISRIGPTITAHSDATDLPSNPVYKKTGARDASDCQASTTGFSTGNSITGVVTAKYYCFKVTDKNGNTGYGEIQIGEAPVLSLGQNQIQVAATATSSGSLDSDSWQNFKTFSLVAPDCDQADKSLFGPASSAANIITISVPDNNKWVCFRARNSNNIYGYARHQIDYNPPRIAVSIVGTTVTAHTDATDLDVGTWQKRHSSIDTDCDSSAAGFVAAGNPPSFVNVHYSQFYCFKATDKNGNTGYRGFYTVEVPVVTVEQTATRVTARAVSSGVVDNDSWQNFKTSDGAEPDCDQADKSLFGPASVTAGSLSLTSSDNNQWVCFRVSNTNSVYGYNKKQLTGIVSRQPNISPPPLSGPQLVISQSGSRLSAEAPAGSGFAYFISETEPDCSENNRTAVWVDGQTTTSLTDKQWVCFRARSPAAVNGYAKARVDLTAPVLNLQQTETGITASGSDLTAFAYFKSVPEPVCDQSNQTAYTPGSSADNLLAGQWVCFKAENNLGVGGYAKARFVLAEYIPPVSRPKTVQADDQTPGRPTTENNSPRPPAAETIEPVSGQVEVETPKLDLRYEGTAIMVVDSGLDDYQFFISDSQPECSSRVGPKTWTGGLEAAGLVPGQWVCFRGKNQAGVYGYASLRAVEPDQAITSGVSVTGDAKDQPPAASSRDPIIWLLVLVPVLPVAVYGSVRFFRRRNN